MNVEWLGGPNDGYVFAVPDKTWIINIAKPVDFYGLMAMSKEDTALTGALELEEHHVAIQIRRRTNGKFVAPYPKGLS